MTHERTIIDTISGIVSAKGIAMAGIDGLGGAGKSTVSESICAGLEKAGVHTVLLHIDDFIHTRAIRYDSSRPDWECYYDLQWRYDYFRECVAKLRKGGETEIELYDKDNDTYYTQKYTTDSRTAVIVEGIFLQRNELEGIFDYMIYIDIPEDVRLQRVLMRDTYIGNENEIRAKYENRYFPAERRYFSRYRPDMSADICIGEK